MRKTRIICTLGPATESREMLREMITAGADVFRLNMSHARHDWCRDVVKNIREISGEVGKTVGVLFDLQGPSIRTGDVDEKIALAKGDRVEFRAEGSEPQLEKSTTVNYSGLMSDVLEGSELTVDNGELLMKVETISEDRMTCEVLTAGAMGSRRHINLPGVRLNLPALTEKDHADIKVAAECQADFVAGSFVRDAGHVRELRGALEAAGGKAQIVSKLEDQEAMKHLDDIIRESDVIMVARGDLGIEVHVEELPIIQRRIVKRCHQLGRRVIVATHMLESMISSPTPTRAEVTDVSNAVFEEADAIMLSGETTVGKYPVRCVELMDRVARRIERSGGLGYGLEVALKTEKQKTIKAAIGLADSISNALLIVFTKSGLTANQAALIRPKSPIFAFTPEAQSCQALTLSRGVRTFEMPFCELPRDTISAAVELLISHRDVEPGTPLVVVSDLLHRDHAVDSILLVHA
ncbi:pyruvate kinase [Akkermansiaceae bacterium]|nr:pyruvate kinase [Akkermansiaceae bacterium]MDA7888417.1 pyruvate kinase [Akkermansiaceae bacterium]MDB4544647.1 pyruvate kinase [Akkermansiaceae bacterium]